MEPRVARNIAQYSHLDQRDRFGGLLTEHVERVAAHVPDDAVALAYLHDVLERTPTPLAELEANGLTDTEHAALDLLTRNAGESYEAYILRIAYARGWAAHLARTVKLADIDDHLAHAPMPDDAPPYAWARRHIANRQDHSLDTRAVA